MRSPGPDARPGHNLRDASHAAERLRESIAADQLAGVAVTISGGLTTATGPGIEYDAMLRAADEALYRAKANGRNQICASAETADPAMATSYSS